MNKAEEIAKLTGRSRVCIYKLAQKLGRLPTPKEVLERKAGRPRKYK